MALTDQPYLPLYVNDWMNNNKLKLCSPASHGLMISIMCLMHKSEDYGKILLKQRYKQTDDQIRNFASQVARQTAFDLVDVEPALRELLDEEVLVLEGDFLVCRRMVKDAELSVIRSKSGGKGGKRTQENARSNASDFAKANNIANTEIEYENNIEIDTDLGKGSNEEEGTGETNPLGSHIEAKWRTRPSQDDLDMELPEVKVGSIIELFKFSKNVDVTREQVLGLWGSFKKQYFNGEEFYRTKNAVHSHFINWAKKQTIQNGTYRQTSTARNVRYSNNKSAGANELLGMLKQDLGLNG